MSNSKSNLGKCLHNEDFVVQLTYLADIFSNLNEPNIYKKWKGKMYLQCMTSFEVSWENFSAEEKYWRPQLCLFWHNAHFYNTMETRERIITNIFVHLNMLKDSFDRYFFEETKNFQRKKWITNQFQDDMAYKLINLKTHHWKTNSVAVH